MVKAYIAEFEAMERAILEAPGAVWDVQLAKLMCVALGLAAARAFPELITLDLHWYLLLAAAFAARPAVRAVRLLLRRSATATAG